MNNIKINSFYFHNDYPTTVNVNGEMIRIEPKDGSYLNGYVIVK